MTFAVRRHLRQLEIELAKYGREVFPRRHHFANVIIGHRDPVQASAEEDYVVFTEKTVHVLPVESRVGGFPLRGRPAQTPHFAHGIGNLQASEDPFAHVCHSSCPPLTPA